MPSSEPTPYPLSVTIRQSISCGSFISDFLTFAGEQHYYLFINPRDDLYITISTIPNGLQSTFDTDLTLYDTNLNEILYVDGLDGNNYMAILNTTLNAGTYIVMLHDYYNSTVGQYYMSVTCIGPTTMPTTSNPTQPTSAPSTYSPSQPTESPIPSPYTPWYVSDYRLPVGNQQMAVGYDHIDNIIHVIGGVAPTPCSATTTTTTTAPDNATTTSLPWTVEGCEIQGGKSLIKYHLDKSGNITLMEISSLSTSVRGEAQFYAQLGNILYISWSDTIGFIDELQSFLYVYNLRTSEFIGHGYTVPYLLSGEQCVVAFSAEDYYIMIFGATGGLSEYNNVISLYNVISGEWLPAPTTWTNRRESACVVMDYKVYEIGGYPSSGFDIEWTTEIVYLDVYDVKNLNNGDYGWLEYYPSNWNWTGSSPIKEVINEWFLSPKCVTYRTDIICISGQQEVVVIDTVKDEIYKAGTTPGDENNYKGYMYQSVVMSYPYIYTFGGAKTTDISFDSGEDIIQYHKMDTTQFEEFHDIMSPVSIIPDIDFLRVNSTVNIRSRIENTTDNVNYYAKFRINGGDNFGIKDNGQCAQDGLRACTYPTISIFFKDTDFNSSEDDTKFLNVYYENERIVSCGGLNDNEFKYCLSEKDLQVQNDEICQGQTIVIRLEKGKGSGIPSGTYFSLWADVTLQCGDTTGLYMLYTFTVFDKF